MVLTLDKIKKITELLQKRPFCINELSEKLNVNWRTADRYINEIGQKTGNIGLHTFRKGTRGALKVAFLKNLAKIETSESDEMQLQKRIFNGVDKSDFSPFDIYQFAHPSKRNAFWEEKTKSDLFFYGVHDINQLIKQSETEYLSFSGDFSWIEEELSETTLKKTLKNIKGKQISIKMLGRIGFSNLSSVEKILDLNKKLGKDLIEIRHIHQPLRGGIVDDKTVRLVETFPGIEEKKKIVYYEISDKKWINWLREVFWKLFRKGIPSEKRIEDLHTIHKHPALELEE